MRVEYHFNLNDVDVPVFAVEAVEGIGKLFTLATLVLNVLENRPKVSLVFHGLNREDPARKFETFREILSGSGRGEGVHYELGQGAQLAGASGYYQWVSCERDKV